MEQQDLNLETSEHRQAIEHGQRLKDRGQGVVESNNENFVWLMRKKAELIESISGQVSIDDLRRWAAERNIEPDHCNAWGTIFKGKNWVAIGRIRSAIPSNHARWITVWQRRKY